MNSPLVAGRPSPRTVALLTQAGERTPSPQWQEWKEKTTVLDTLKRVQTVLQRVFSPAKTITGAIFWSLAMVATSFIGAVGVVFVTSVRPDATTTDYVQRAEHAVALVLAISVPIIAAMGAIFLICLIGKALYHLLKQQERRKPRNRTTADDETGTVIPFERRKTSTL